MPAPKGPRAPAHLTAARRELWKSIVRDYDHELDDARHELLRLFCEALDTAEEARSLTRADGLVTDTAAGGLKAHPAVAIEHNARLSAARLWRELSPTEGPAPDARPAPMPQYRGAR